MSDVQKTEDRSRVAGQSKKTVWAGRIIGGIPALMLIAGGLNSFTKSPQVIEGLKHLAYPEHLLVPIGLLEIACVVLYLIPRTSLFGAILLTGYFGGATASHVRVEEPVFVVPIVFGVLVWVGLFLRDPRWRSLLFRQDIL